MSKEEIIERLKRIIEEQGKYHAFNKYTRPKLEKLIEDIERS